MKKPYTPKIGDRVSALNTGPWDVIAILTDPDRVTIRLVGTTHEKTVPLSGVSPLKKEDFSQAAVRIVREATENS